MMKFFFFYIIGFLSILIFNVNTTRLCYSDICELEGYTLIECSEIVGDFNGEDGEVIKLYNDMIFEIEDSYGYGYYSSNEDVAIFKKVFTYQGRNYQYYMLLIDENLFEVERVR